MSQPLLSRIRRAGAAAAIAALSLGAQAQAQDTVYRCGPDGRTYSNTPCPNGKAVDVADPRSADQRRDAQDAAAREASLGDQLARERKAREREAARQGPAAIGSSRKVADAPASAASSPKKRKKRGKSTHTTLAEDGRMTPPLKGGDSPAAKKKSRQN